MTVKSPFGLLPTADEIQTNHNNNNNNINMNNNQEINKDEIEIVYHTYNQQNGSSTPLGKSPPRDAIINHHQKIERFVSVNFLKSKRGYKIRFLTNSKNQKDIEENCKENETESDQLSDNKMQKSKLSLNRKSSSNNNLISSNNNCSGHNDTCSPCSTTTSIVAPFISKVNFILAIVQKFKNLFENFS